MTECNRLRSKITMNMAQMGASLSGSFTWDGVSGPGSIRGSVADSTVSASLILKNQPECALALTGTVAGDQLSGRTTFQCTGPVTIGNPSTSPANFIRTR